ncbi:transcriptional regulator [Streptomyces longispororuber]|uniref:Transcriptional regulator n=1 Tax=Streptomyces longispororuber TaxID=68230 RepID=A0A918ZJV1_9ACTN|nr:DUF5753 domain-containing protein [Streptomyces longispororuber]GHE56975.1 transcriptional regulator [Streptomyces longispororuber]
MPPSTSPTLRQRRLGSELRKLRQQAGLTATAAAALLGVNQAQISSIEAGRYPVSADRVRSFARSYDCADEALVDALAAMTGGRTRGWWDEYQGLPLPAGLNDVAELEHHASGLRVALVTHIPALLQTTDYARALFQEVVPPLRQYEVEHRLSHRIKRQGVLHQDSPPSYTAIVHETALRIGFGGPTVTRAQLRHLLEMSELPNVTFRVIPFGQASFPGSGQSVDYVMGPVPQLDTVLLDTHHGSEFLDSEPELAAYRSLLSRLESASLSPAASRDLMRGLTRDT